MRKQLVNRSRLVALAPVAALALLAGCFRPAGDSIQPTSPSTIESVEQPAGAATATPGEPAITLLSPDTAATSNTTSNVTSDGTVIPAITEVTVIPFEPTTTPTPIEGTLTPTLQIITPGASLSMITPDAPTPLPTDELGSIISETTLEPLASINSSGIEATELVSGAECTYTVESGDSLYSIALDNDTTVDSLKSVNAELEGDDPVLQIGQVLALPDCIPGQPRPTSAPVESSELSDDSTAVPAAVATQDVYTVKPGDTLYSIASRYGITVNAIVRANNLANPNTLSIGQKLVIPEKAQ